MAEGREHAAEHIGKLGEYVAAAEQDVDAREKAQPDAFGGATRVVTLVIDAHLRGVYVTVTHC